MKNIEAKSRLEQNAEYFEKNFESYQLSCACSKKSCEHCKNMNGKIFKFKDRKIGINFPPFHEGCKCVFTVYVPDEQEWIEEYVKKHQ